MKIDIATQIKINEQILLHLEAALDEMKSSTVTCIRYVLVPHGYMGQRINIF